MRGHADDMISRLKNNAILQRRYRERHQRMYDALTKEFTNHHLKNPDISKEQRDAIKAKIRKTIKIERRSAMIKTVSISAVIAIIIILLFLQNTYAQGIVSEENRWNVLGEEFTSSYRSTTICTINGDSNVNSLDYKMMSMYDCLTYETYQGGLLREDSNRVYYIIPQEAEEGLLYDFNAVTGDTCSIINFVGNDQPFNVYVTNIDTAEYFGIERKRWFLVDDYGNEDFWLEGIGSSNGPVHGMMRHSLPPYWAVNLLCYYHSDTLLYRKEGYSSCIITQVGVDELTVEQDIFIYPNPARNKFKVRSTEFGLDLVEIFDMAGRIVLEQQLTEGTKEFEVDISKLLPGSYLCSFTSGEKKLTRKVFVR